MTNQQQPGPYVVAGGEPTSAAQNLEAPASRPIAAAPIVQPAVVAPAPPVAQPVARRRVATWTGRRIAIDSVVVGLVGIVMLTFGLVALARAGLDGPMNEPVVDVVGFTTTATLGLVIAGFGLCLLICAATASRAGAVFFGIVLGIAGFVAAVQTTSFERTLAIESSLAWIAVGAAVLVVLVSLLLPRTSLQTTRVTTD